MLAFYPLSNGLHKGIWAENADHRAKGENFDEKLRFILNVIVDRAVIDLLLFVIFGLFSVLGKVKHTAFQGIALPADFYDNGGGCWCVHVGEIRWIFFISVRKFAFGQRTCLNPAHIKTVRMVISPPKAGDADYAEFVIPRGIQDFFGNDLIGRTVACFSCVGDKNRLFLSRGSLF